MITLILLTVKNDIFYWSNNFGTSTGRLHALKQLIENFFFNFMNQLYFRIHWI